MPRPRPRQTRTAPPTNADLAERRVAARMWRVALIHEQWREGARLLAWETAFAEGRRCCGTDDFNRAQRDWIAAGHPEPPRP